ncbi:hypothetical protein [Streptomyces sp. NPDC018693]|uniref:hypothetical protein n=1 Tax=unclassified Streptomyces TaxID=2593676 RepID=UPI0037BAA838
MEGPASPPVASTGRSGEPECAAALLALPPWLPHGDEITLRMLGSSTSGPYGHSSRIAAAPAPDHPLFG